MSAYESRVDAQKTASDMVTTIQTARMFTTDAPLCSVLDQLEESAMHVVSCLEEMAGKRTALPEEAPTTEGGGKKFDGLAFGNYLRERCVNRNELARQSGVGKETLYFWTTGRTDYPSNRSMAKVADALGVSFGWFAQTFMTRAD